MRDPKGNRQGYLLACEDITVKKAQEREIIESYKKIKSNTKGIITSLECWEAILMELQYKKRVCFANSMFISKILRKDHCNPYMRASIPTTEINSWHYWKQLLINRSSRKTELY